MASIMWERDNGEGEVEVLEVPAKWTVCDGCGGEGRVLSPAFRGQLDSEFMEDEEFMQEYKKGGRGIYSCACPECNGRTTVLAPDTSTAIGREYAAWKCEEEWERRAERRMMMMECGDVEGFLSGW